MIEVKKTEYKEEVVEFIPIDKEVLVFNTDLADRFILFLDKEKDDIAKGYYSELFLENSKGNMQFFASLEQVADNYEDAKRLVLQEYAEILSAGDFDDMVKKYYSKNRW